MNRFTLDIETDGNGDIINLQPLLAPRIKELKGPGVVMLFVVGSTAALTTVEFENGLVKHDLPAAFQRLAADDLRYEHEATWHDDNGHSHVRASLVGPSLSIPFENGKLMTGEYQQPILIDFDTRPRRRKVIVTIVV